MNLVGSRLIRSMPADEAEEKMNSKMDVDVIAKKKGGDGTEQKD